MLHKAELVGQRFGRLVVIREDGRNRRAVMWLCHCDCGSTSGRPV